MNMNRNQLHALYSFYLFIYLLTIYLRTLSVAHDILHRTTVRFASNEVEEMWNEAAVASLEVQY
jgi:hypothetical protein